MSRDPLPQRRQSKTCDITFGAAQIELDVTYGFDEFNRVKECFCRSGKSGTDMQALITDACITLSLLLQHGMMMDEIADKLGEDRPEGSTSGPPSSPIGAIARMGVAVEKEARGG